MCGQPFAGGGVCVPWMTGCLCVVVACDMSVGRGFDFVLLFGCFCVWICFYVVIGLVHWLVG